MKMLMRQHDSMKKAGKERLERSSQGHGTAHCREHHSERPEITSPMDCMGWLLQPHVLKCLYTKVRGGSPLKKVQVSTVHHSGQSEFSNRKQEPRNQPYTNLSENPASPTPTLSRGAAL